MKLIVISNPINIDNEHTVLCSLFENGLAYFHLRKPEFTYDELKEYIQGIPQQHRNKVVVHSHHQLAVEYGLKGIHYTYKNPFQGSDNFPKDMHRSASLHSLEEIENAAPVFQYLFISPVFDSISKADHKTQIDKTALKLFLQRETKTSEVIALGGINSDTIAEAADMGFDGMALLGSIWMSNEPIESFKLLLSVTSGFNTIENNIYV